MLTVYAATNPENARAVADMIRDEAQKLAHDGLTEVEFRKAKEQLRASFILGQESTSSRMHALGRRLLLLNKTRSEDEAIARVMAIDFEATNKLLRDVLTTEPAVAVVARGAEGLDLG
jgi:predicted Zn-dependent peptidase